MQWLDKFRAMCVDLTIFVRCAMVDKFHAMFNEKTYKFVETLLKIYAAHIKWGKNTKHAEFSAKSMFLCILHFNVYFVFFWGYPPDS